MQEIRVKGARMHNLKNVNVSIPRNKLTVITGLSGSGKSSLAFDTIFAEGQRRYVESLSAYARQFIAQMEKPDVDSIEGLSPAISIDQKTATHNPRSTVGTVTEIYDYMRLLWAKVGRVHCSECGKELTRQSASQIVQTIAEMKDGSKILLLAPLVNGRKGEHTKILDSIKREGFVRMRIDGQIMTVDEEIKLDPKKAHTIEIVVDRLVIRDLEPKTEKLKDGTEVEKPNPNRTRLADSIELALKKGSGMLVVVDVTEEGKEKERRFCESFVCPDHPDLDIPQIEPRSFSFNSPHGACEACHGLGTILRIDEVRIIPNPTLTIAEGAIHPWATSAGRMGFMMQILDAAAKHFGFKLTTPWTDMSDAHKKIILQGSPEPLDVHYLSDKFEGKYQTTFEGVLPNLQRRYSDTDSAYTRSQIEEYMETLPCADCGGDRLRREVLGIAIGVKNIVQATKLPIDQAKGFFESLVPHGEKNEQRKTNNEKPAQKLSSHDYAIAKKILVEIINRLSFLENVGLSYLTLERSAATLSGGEAQRIRLATQIGSALEGVLYVLYEPRIGLHQRD